MEPTFTYPFSDLYADVGEYMGVGRSPTGTSLDTVKRRVNDAYRRFLAAHDWNFLKRSTVLPTESGKWQYQLPDDFSSLAVPFTYPKDNSWINPKETDEATILELRTGSGSTSGRPYLFAIRPKEYTEGEGTRWEVIFHYTPGSVYDMIYTYRITVSELVNDADKPIGGAEHSQTLRDFCLAEVEAFDEEKPGTFSVRLIESLARSIERDKKKSPRSVGIMGSKSFGCERRIKVTVDGVEY